MQMRRRESEPDEKPRSEPLVQSDAVTLNTIKTTTAGAEARLVERLNMLAENPGAWTVIYFAFNRLLDHYRSDYQIKIALNLMKDLLKEHEGHLFLCKDSTIFLLGEKLPRQLIDKVIFQLRYLFMDDPLAYTPEGDENMAFCDVYNLGSDFPAVETLARQKLLLDARANRPATEKPAGPSLSPVIASVTKLVHGAQTPFMEPVKMAMKFLSAASLATIEKDLNRADLSIVLRRQPICAAIPDMTVRKVFDEIYINIAHLRQMLRLDVDLIGNRWLFKALTETLDERVLHMLRLAPGRYIETPISLNLNIRTLMSDHFFEFDAALKPSVKVAVVLEIQIADVFEDMRGFMQARDAVQRMGYRVCLDGLSDVAFAQIDRESLGCDLIKLQWNAEIAGDENHTTNQKMAEAVRRCGPNRIILTRCDNRKAVDYGQSLGISLFQGRYLDKLMNPLSKVEN